MMNCKSLSTNALLQAGSYDPLVRAKESKLKTTYIKLYFRRCCVAKRVADNDILISPTTFKL